MHLTKSTRYAIEAAIEMALAGSEPVTVGQVASRYRIPEGALAKVFQQLVRAGIASGTRGVGGGYRLARPASRVTLQDVIQVFESHRTESERLFAGSAPAADLRSPPVARLRRLFDEVDELVRSTFESVTLQTLARGPALRSARASDSRLPSERQRPSAAPSSTPRG